MNEAELLKLVGNLGMGGGAICLAFTVWRANQRLVKTLVESFTGVIKENSALLVEVRDRLKSHE